MLTVRRAALNDAPAIAAVHIASWRAAYRGLMPDQVLDELSLEARERDWRGWLSEGGAREFTLVAERDGTPVAFCTLEMPAREEDEPDDVAAIPALYADPEAFGTGAGAALMAAALEALGEAGYREVILWMLKGNGRPRPSTSATDGGVTAAGVEATIPASATTPTTSGRSKSGTACHSTDSAMSRRAPRGRRRGRA
jgi:GNAT superfamily N-acetyltransferase